MNNEVLVKNFTAASAIPRYRAVIASGNRQLSLATNGTRPILGVANAKAELNGSADALLMGFQAIECGGAIAAGDAITADGEGRAVAATDGDYCIGTAVTAAVSGDIVDVVVNPFRN